MENKKHNFALEVLLWFFSIMVIYPLLMIIMTSFKSYGEANFLNVRIPETWLFENYKQVFLEGKIFTSFLNSMYITVLSVILTILLSSMLSYVIARRNTILDRRIYRFLTFGIIAPFAALPTIRLLKIIGLYGSRLSLILIYAAIYMPFSTMLFSGFIKTVPRELDEAAIIDGCTGINLFTRIIFPLIQPMTVTISILVFMWAWNDFQYPIYLLNSSSKWTLPLSVYNFFGQYNRSWNLVCADMVIVSLPVVILYVLAQKYIIDGMTAGAVKG